MPVSPAPVIRRLTCFLPFRRLRALALSFSVTRPVPVLPTLTVAVPTIVDAARMTNLRFPGLAPRNVTVTPRRSAVASFVLDAVNGLAALAPVVARGVTAVFEGTTGDGDGAGPPGAGPPGPGPGVGGA